MQIRRIGLTALLVALAGLVMLLPSVAQEALYYDRALIESGEWWRLLTGHWVHADTGHLLWNIAALGILAAIIEQRTRALLILSLLAGPLSIDALLLSDLSNVQRYCGVSGILNTLFGVVLMLYWRETRSRLVILAAVLYAGKVIVEVVSGDAIFTETSWPPYAPAHVAGLLGMPIAWLMYKTIAAGLASRNTIKNTTLLNLKSQQKREWL